MADLPLAVVLVTAPSHDVAEQIVHALVEERLAACGNIVPGVASLYRWQGEVQRESEVLIVIKTTRAVLARLITRVTELHPYDTPEVLALPVDAGLQSYTAWIAANVHE